MLISMLLAAGLEVEFGGGVTHSLDEYMYPNNPLFPVIEARAAVKLHPSFSVGVGFLAVVGKEAHYYPDGCDRVYSDQTGFRAFATLLQARALLPGPVTLWAQGGAGIGHLVALQALECFEHPPLRGRAGPVFEASIGARASATPSLAFGLQASWMLWTGVERPAGAYFQARPYASGLSSAALLLLGTVTFDVFH